MEIEAKLKIQSLDALRAKLEARTAQRIGRVLEINYILDHADGSLARRGAALRVRGVTAIDGSQPAALLTFKGPILVGRFKTREEIEVALGNADDTVRILESAGFCVVLQFEKRRESWRLNDCRVELDELPILGAFVEIEGPTESAIDVALSALDLQTAPVADQTYVAMLVAHCNAHGPADRVVRFQADPSDR
jgi:adenylate cyclase class 2